MRAAVARYLGTVGGDGAAELVTMTGDGAAEVRAAAIAALAAGGGGRAALPDATRFLADESLAVRLAAVALVAKAGGKPALEALLAHADPMVAATAAHRRGDRAAAVAVFDRALGATDVGTRAGVVNLLAAALPQDAAIARATAALADPAPTVKLAAARALAYLGQHGAALTALTALAATAAPADRADAAAELARLGDPHGAAILTELAGSPDADVRRAVVQAHVGAGAITAGLWGALADDQAATRLDAAIARARGSSERSICWATSGAWPNERSTATAAAAATASSSSPIALPTSSASSSISRRSIARIAVSRSAADGDVTPCHTVVSAIVRSALRSSVPPCCARHAR